MIYTQILTPTFAHGARFDFIEFGNMSASKIDIGHDLLYAN
ncbi:hypothetical protein [Robiginitalea biformata]